MPDQALAPIPGTPVGPGRFIPPLPAGVPILPGQVAAPKRKRAMRMPAGLILLLVFVGLVAFSWFSIWYSDSRSAKEFKRTDDDTQLVVQAVTPLLLTHAPRGTRFPVTLSGGPRLLQIEFTVVHRQRGKLPTTCVWLSVFDPKTGARDQPQTPCIPGLDYLIQQQ